MAARMRIIHGDLLTQGLFTDVWEQEGEPQKKHRHHRLSDCGAPHSSGLFGRGKTVAITRTQKSLGEKSILEKKKRCPLSGGTYSLR